MIIDVISKNLALIDEKLGERFREMIFAYLNACNTCVQKALKCMPHKPLICYIFLAESQKISIIFMARNRKTYILTNPNIFLFIETWESSPRLTMASQKNRLAQGVLDQSPVTLSPFALSVDDSTISMF